MRFEEPEMIRAKDNVRIKAAVRLRDDARERRDQGRFFLEGYRLCADALLSGCAPETLFLTKAARESYDTAALEAAAGQVFLVPTELAGKLGDTKHPQGIFAVLRTPPEAPWHFRLRGRYAALEGIQDPANLGAVARTAEALGADGLLLCGGCDRFHPKAQRTAMGSLLRLPVLETADLPAALAEAEALGIPAYAAVPDASAPAVTEMDGSGGGILVVGNEGNGLSAGLLAVCPRRVTIPMRGRAESLNAAAAAAILLWELMGRCIPARAAAEF
ncbi:MAG: RNA methyltransferase [Oscillospiraceae bacterium]|jgi:TrmH family RNA methyltransferase|nr:RNA methyltransferase [Oscillospiraceae bacterium]